MEGSPPIGQRPRLLLQGGARVFRPTPFDCVVLLTVLIVAAVGGFYAYASATDLNTTAPAAPSYLPAFRTTLTSSVSATGTVQSGQQVTLTFDIGQGSAKIKEMQVRLGDQVTAGQSLARLEDADLQLTLRSAQANLASAQARYDAAFRGPTASETAAAQQSVASAQSQVATTQKNLDDLLAKPTALDLSNAQQALLAAQIAQQKANDDLIKATNDLTLARGELDVAQANLLAAAKNPSGLVAAQTAVTRAELNVVTALNTLNNGNLQRSMQNAELGLLEAIQAQADVQAGPKPIEIELARRGLEAAQASLAAAQARQSDLFKPATPDVTEPLRASVEQARASVATAEKNLNAATITAPFDGVISQVTGDVGTHVNANTSVFILVNPRLIRIDANVDQADVSNLKAGQTANISFDALSGRSYQAIVSAIGLTPTITQGVVTYVVSLAVDTSRLATDTPVPAPGMTASIAVTTNRTENALVVPSRAVRRSGRTQTVSVKTPAGDEQRQVTTGASNGTLVQVLTGLEEGDEVLVSAPVTTTTTTNTNPNRQQQFTGPGGGGQFVVPAPGR